MTLSSFLWNSMFAQLHCASLHTFAYYIQYVVFLFVRVRCKHGQGANACRAWFWLHLIANYLTIIVKERILQRTITYTFVLHLYIQVPADCCRYWSVRRVHIEVVVQWLGPWVMIVARLRNVGSNTLRRTAKAQGFIANFCKWNLHTTVVWKMPPLEKGKHHVYFYIQETSRKQFWNFLGCMFVCGGFIVAAGFQVSFGPSICESWVDPNSCSVAARCLDGNHRCWQRGAHRNTILETQMLTAPHVQIWMKLIERAIALSLFWNFSFILGSNRHFYT